MATQVPGGWWWPEMRLGTTGKIVGAGSTPPRFMVVQAPKAGVISRIELPTSNQIASAPMRVACQEVLSSGLLSGVDQQIADIPMLGSFTWAISDPLSAGGRMVTEGELVGLAFTMTGPGFQQVQIPWWSSVEHKLPYGGDGGGKEFHIPIVVFQYDDGVRLTARGSAPPILQGTSNLTLVGADEAGVVFESTYNGICDGGSLILALNGNWEMTLYDAADVELGKMAWTLLQAAGAGTPTWPALGFWNGVQLTRGATYRLAVAPTSGDLQVSRCDVVAEVADLVLGPFTSRSGGPWADDPLIYVPAQLHMTAIGV